MSTDIYGIRVNEVKGCVVKFSVNLINHDWTHLPENKTFFLCILWDEADTRFGKGGPLGDEISLDQILDKEFVAQNARRYIESVTCTSTRNYPMDPPDKYATFSSERDEEWVDEDKLAEGTYEVRVTDPKWVAHLKPGMMWTTTSYDSEEAPWVREPGEEEEAVDFKGKRVALTGTLSLTRKEAQTMLQALGAKPCASIGKRTDYVIAGEKAGSKLGDASALGIPILAEAFLLNAHAAIAAK